MILVMRTNALEDANHYASQRTPSILKPNFHWATQAAMDVHAGADEKDY